MTLFKSTLKINKPFKNIYQSIQALQVLRLRTIFTFLVESFWGTCIIKECGVVLVVYSLWVYFILTFFSPALTSFCC